MGDQWLELRRQLLISRDKGDTLSRRFRDAFATLSLVTTYFYFIYLLDAIVTSFVVLYRPPRNSVPILQSILAISANAPISTRFLSGTRDLLL